MEALKAALKNKEKPLLPFAVLGLLSLAAVINVIMSWGERRFEGVEAGQLDLLVAASTLIAIVGWAWKYSQSFFRTPIAALLVVSVLYDTWLYWSQSVAVYGLESLAIETSWVLAAAVLYFDTNTAHPIQAEER